ncbi:hypothetical protein LSUB1_G003086 [Lachnellula subtilissima]|uniref:Uncharacterized protein n=1 Tax=Lachnellula subtilissima TaxID=602034 RepID=A0A8H8RW15_9HELO|nr:hypothetical protein LSUB1_G003086 [Lachnellula subtilissima]
MLHQKLVTLVALLQSSVVRSAILPSEYLDARDDDTFNNTLDGRDDTHPLNPSERGMLDDLNNAYEGIWWDKSYPGGAAPRGNAKDGGCDVASFNIIREATRNAVRLAGYQGADLLKEDRSFNKFFVRNSIAPAGGRWTSSKNAQNTYASINHNMILPSRFPLDGTGRRRRGQRVTYQCKDTQTLPWTTKGCAGPAAAYTDTSNITFAGWTVVFCQKFFQSGKYLNTLLAGPKISEASLGALKYVSYEQIILHEWLHNDIMGYSEHLTDIVDQIDDNSPKRRVYGMSEARDYAWKFMTGNKKNINQKIVANVENYVWYFVDKMYGKQWGWTGTGNAYPGKPLGRDVNLIVRQDDVQADTLDLGDEETDPATLPTPSWPSNCHGDLVIDASDASALVCDYVDPPNEDSSTPTSTSSASAVVTLPADPKNCNCNEDGCTPESPACCGNGTC